MRLKDRLKEAVQKSKYQKKLRLLKFVQLLSLFLAFLGVTYISYPYLPALKFLINKPDGNKIEYQVQTKHFVVKAKAKEVPKENRLIIPSIGVDTQILEGISINILNHNEGVLREHMTGTPDSGNMVIAGHRFQYLPPNTTTFYNLDKVKKYEHLIVFWKGKEYIYKVIQIKEVMPTEVDIRNQIKGIDHQLTIYTCTPLGTSSKRLVVISELAKE